MPAAPFVSEVPLRFRGVSDSLADFHIEASECCLIHVDNPLKLEKRVYINPFVRVAYSTEAYDYVHSQQYLGYPMAMIAALWKNRILRWTTPSWLRTWQVRRRTDRWRGLSNLNVESGDICLVGETQVLLPNGWAHTV